MIRFRPFGAGVGVLALNLGVFNGVPFDFSPTLHAVARADRDAALRQGFDGSPGYLNSLGTADFLHTMLLDELSAHAAAREAVLAGLLGLLAWRCSCRGPTARSSR